MAEYKEGGQLEEYESRLSANRAELTGLSYTGEKKNTKRILHLKDEIIKDTNRVEIVQMPLRRLESSRGLQDVLGREKDAIRTQQAARMLELEKKLAEYREKYGVFPGGEKAAREVLLPKKSGENEKISQTVRTILETKATPEEMVPDIMELAMEGKYSCEEASREVVADACEMMLGNSTVVEQLAKENRSLAEKIRDWLREWVENLKIALEGLQADRTESRAMMQYAQELQEIWDNALVDAVRNGRETVQENAPAEVKQQARVGTSESVKPDEKFLKGKRDDGKMGTAKASLKEDFEDGKARKENRGDFLRRTVEEGYQVFEGKSAAYGYRPVRRESAGENAQQIQKELTELGIDAEIIDGDILWNLDGISSARRVPQATTVEKNKVMVSTDASLAPRNTAGHEAFHLWHGLSVRKAFEDVVTDNLIFSSEEFLEYQSVISKAYLGDEADLSDEAQYTKLTEEIIAYISGDIHEGVNDDLLRPMFHDYDAVKDAWVKLCEDRAGGKVQFQQREPRLSDRAVLSLAAEMALRQ